jgi:hypothetical protein
MLISRVYLVRLDRRHDLDDLLCLKGTELVATRQHSTFHIRKNHSSDYILTTRRLAGFYNHRNSGRKSSCIWLFQPQNDFTVNQRR